MNRLEIARQSSSAVDTSEFLSKAKASIKKDVQCRIAFEVRNTMIAFEEQLQRDSMKLVEELVEREASL